MSQQVPAPPPQDEVPPATTDRQRGSTWVFVGLLVLMGGLFVVSRVVSRSGPSIEWEHDLAQAERLAGDQGRYIFLLLYEPGCPVTAANDEHLFSRRDVRERLAKMVCCRIELEPGDLLRDRFGFEGKPLMLALKPGHKEPLTRWEGRVDFRVFRTYLAPDQHLRGD